MLEQPVALATTIRSPKSWVTRRMYGVSPQPAQAPENSNSGSSWAAPLTVSRGSALRSSGGIARKASHFSRSMSRRSRYGTMLMALCPTSVLLLAGQTSTQTPHPVQSSGATWIVSRWPGRSRDLNSLVTKPASAGTSASGKTFIRMLACGQTMAHLPQSMQIVSSQSGICWAMARFSHLVVPVGKVPSTGSALTGSRSPSPAMSRAVTCWTKSGAWSGTSALRTCAVFTAPSVTLPRRAMDASMAA